MADPRPQGQLDEAAVDLLIKQVTEGLAPAEQRALDALDGPLVKWNLDAFERAAAAIGLAAAGALQTPPDTLLVRLERQASSYERARPTQVGEPMRSAGRNTASGISWPWIAAAACLVLAVVGWLRGPLTPQVPAVAIEKPVRHVPPASRPAPAPPTPEDQRTALLASPASIKVLLSATKDPAAVGVTGDAVWDSAAQTGFLHFVGLKSNDPAVMQYEIWIFDATRDKRYPIPGGVFDVPAGSSEIVLPIRAEILVHAPAAFAVTAEKPGGVVVSDRAHVIVLGAATASPAAGSAATAS